MVIAKMPFVINSITVIPIAIQNSIKPTNRFILCSVKSVYTFSIYTFYKLVVYFFVKKGYNSKSMR